MSNVVNPKPETIPSRGLLLGVFLFDMIKHDPQTCLVIDG